MLQRMYRLVKKTNKWCGSKCQYIDSVYSLYMFVLVGKDGHTQLLNVMCHARGNTNKLTNAVTSVSKYEH